MVRTLEFQRVCFLSACLNMAPIAHKNRRSGVRGAHSKSYIFV